MREKASALGGMTWTVITRLVGDECPLMAAAISHYTVTQPDLSGPVAVVGLTAVTFDAIVRRVGRLDVQAHALR